MIVSCLYFIRKARFSVRTAILFKKTYLGLFIRRTILFNYDNCLIKITLLRISYIGKREIEHDDFTNKFFMETLFSIIACSLFIAGEQKQFYFPISLFLFSTKVSLLALPINRVYFKNNLYWL